MKMVIDGSLSRDCDPADPFRMASFAEDVLSGWKVHDTLPTPSFSWQANLMHSAPADAV